ncbi:MAG TPA: guanosine monophosphate reductase [Candidatus Pacearchaeota archaeon]|nr:guanosine monophosphate reductase [Candidatus Pacearchaeota archaeon]
MARIIGKGYSYNDVLIIPKYNKVLSRKDVNLETFVTKNHKIKIPILAANMDTVCESEMAIALGKLGGLGVIHRFMTIENQAKEVKRVKEQNLLAAAAIGIKDFQERVKTLVESGVDIIVIDIAHGHSKYAGKTLDFLKENYPKIDVMAGNIATKDAAEYFISKGADALKVGIGAGSVCTTRTMTGVGIPQVTAVMDVHEASQGKIPICADQAIRNPGDVTKALGAGANTVMLGYVFAASEESPGEIIIKNGKKFKIYRGMASLEAMAEKNKLKNENHEVISIEGEKTLIPYKGPIKPIVEKFLGGLSSGMTYVGAKDTESFIGKSDFVYITSAGRKESSPHGLNNSSK